LHLPATKTLLQNSDPEWICLLPKEILRIQTMSESGARKSVFKFRPWINPLQQNSEERSGEQFAQQFLASSTTPLL
jgi:hypothetical protein